jgi:hypothetical protein
MLIAACIVGGVIVGAVAVLVWLGSALSGARFF